MTNHNPPTPPASTRVAKAAKKALASCILTSPITVGLGVSIKHFGLLWTIQTIGITLVLILAGLLFCALWSWSLDQLWGKE